MRYLTIVLLLAGCMQGQFVCGTCQSNHDPDPKVVEQDVDWINVGILRAQYERGEFTQVAPIH